MTPKTSEKKHRKKLAKKTKCPLNCPENKKAQNASNLRKPPSNKSTQRDDLGFCRLFVWRFESAKKPPRNPWPPKGARLVRRGQCPKRQNSPWRILKVVLFLNQGRTLSVWVVGPRVFPSQIYLVLIRWLVILIRQIGTFPKGVPWSVNESNEGKLGGDFNPSEKNISWIGSFPPSSWWKMVKITNIYLKPPPNNKNHGKVDPRGAYTMYLRMFIIFSLSLSLPRKKNRFLWEAITKKNLKVESWVVFHSHVCQSPTTSFLCHIHSVTPWCGTA